MNDTEKLQETVNLLDNAMAKLEKLKLQNKKNCTKYQQKLKGIVTKVDIYCTDKEDADFLRGDLSYKAFFHKLITSYKEKGGVNA